MQASSLRLSAYPAFERSNSLPVSERSQVHDNNDDLEADLEANGMRRQTMLHLSQSDMATIPVEQNRDTLLRDILGKKRRPEDAWKRFVGPQPEFVRQTCRQHVESNIRPALLSGAAGVTIGGFIGALTGFLTRQGETGDIGPHVRKCFGIGAATGSVAATSLYLALRYGMRPGCGIPSDLRTRPYDRLAIGNNKGIANAPRLSEELRRKLTAMLKSVERTDENDNTVRHLIRILHEKRPSKETEELIDKLRIIIGDYDDDCPVHGELFLARAKGPITSWKLAKMNAPASTVLAKGVKAARANRVEKACAHLHDGHESVPAYLRSHRRALRPYPVDAFEMPSVLKFLGAYDPWRSHVNTNHRALYEAQQALVRDVVTQVDSERPQPEGMAYLKAYNHLDDAHKGKLLLQWYARECFSNEKFLESASDDWLRRTLMREFADLGLPKERIGQVFDEARRKRDGGAAAGIRLQKNP